MANGGKRLGAGRKKAPHTIETEAAKKRLVAMFVESEEAIYQALIAQAQTGNIQAIKELFDRVWGKSVQPISNDGENAFKLEWSSPSSMLPEGGPKVSITA